MGLIDLSQYEDLPMKELVKISELRERVLQLYYEDIPEDIVEYLLKPFEKVLIHNGVNLSEDNF